jgi:hypothetical protein
MEMQCTIAVKAGREEIWPYYVEPQLRAAWEEQLELLEFDAPAATGGCGRMKLAGMPPMDFTLTEVVDESAYCDCTSIPGVGNVHFCHRLLPGDGQTMVQHSVWLEKEAYSDADMGLLQSLFANVPQGLLNIKREVEG